MRWSDYLGIKDVKDLIAKKYNQDFIDIRNWWNDHNSGARTWDTVNATNATITNLTAGGSVGPFLPLAGGTLTGNLAFNPTTKGIVGTVTNNNTTAGNVGEFISSVVATVSAASTGQYQDTATISLTAGDWDVSGLWQVQRNGATWTDCEFGISIGTAGNAFSDNVDGDNRGDFTFVTTSDNYWFVIPPWRVSIASTTIVRLKTLFNYTVATPKTGGARLSARRVR